MSYKSKRWELAAPTLIKNFEKRGMEACYCENSKEALKKVLSLIPKGASVTFGGSETLNETGIFEALTTGPYEFIDRKSARTKEEARALFGKIVCADYFLMSTNAFTKDGELVNIDGNGNRVACLIHGPEHIIVVTGMNKLCESTEDALARIRDTAAPPNAVRVGCKETVCMKTGICGQCLSPDCICCQTVITRKSRHPGRITVILVGEELGF